VASGKPLPAAWREGRISPRGHAIELRLYAEDPVEYLPRTGTVLVWEEPAGPGIRVDSGVERGSRVGLDYDPLLAKLIAFGENRPAAIARAARALEAWVVLGVETNQRLLSAVLSSEAFSSGRYATDLLATIPPLGDTPPPPEAWIAAALALSTPQAPAGAAAAAAPDPWRETGSWRPGR
jgi:acetyl/propionyl-CoA carboxylase alpha subunit